MTTGILEYATTHTRARAIWWAKIEAFHVLSVTGKKSVETSNFCWLAKHISLVY
jgi:hypothetical protein